ncbi:MAG: bacillithiol biosynthesis cysteine-adding enzyme BshC [Myxococcales bacterium]|nr:bacillithiol biosynthesis cysteine-adding enzyme BshC [Myxococcales bacterium]
MSNVAFTPDWLAGRADAVALLPRGFDDPAARRDAARAAAVRRVHPGALEALRRAAARRPTSARDAHLEALAAGGAAVVATGQQPGLFGGPMYSIYKAAAAIVDARALQAEAGVPCVPIFWLQNEDHAWHMIDRCVVLDRAGGLAAMQVPGRPEDEGLPFAARRLGPEVTPALDALGEALEGLSEADAVMALLRDLYRPEAAPDVAFAGLIDALFARHGLLVLDPRDAGVVEAAAPLHARALAEAGPIDAALQARAEALQAAGYAVQVHLRAGAPLSMFHPDGPEGRRYRLEPAGETAWRLCGTDRVVERAAVADAPPDHLGTTALLRPLLQDTLLPTAAYLGGPGEIAYFAQLPPVYAALDVPMPLIVPRARLRVVDETAERLLSQLGLAIDEADAPRDALLRRLATDPGEGRPDADALERSLLTPIEATLTAFREVAGDVDRGLEKAVDKTRETLVEVSRRLVERYRRTLARQDEVTVARLDRLQARLCPEGAPQERVLCWPWFGARYGVEGFVDAVLGAVQPFDGALRTLAP